MKSEQKGRAVRFSCTREGLHVDKRRGNGGECTAASLEGARASRRYFLVPRSRVALPWLRLESVRSVVSIKQRRAAVMTSHAEAQFVCICPRQ